MDVHNWNSPTWGEIPTPAWLGWVLGLLTLHRRLRCIPPVDGRDSRRALRPMARRQSMGAFVCALDRSHSCVLSLGYAMNGEATWFVASPRWGNSVTPFIQPAKLVGGLIEKNNKKGERP